MMLNLLNRQKIEFAGLDIGSSVIKLVRLDKGETGYTLLAAASAAIVPCPDDEKQQRQNCVDAIKTCLQKAALKNGNLVCGISGPEVVVRGFTFPPLPDQAVQIIQMSQQAAKMWKQIYLLNQRPIPQTIEGYDSLFV